MTRCLPEPTASSRNAMVIDFHTRMQTNTYGPPLRPNVPKTSAPGGTRTSDPEYGKSGVGANYALQPQSEASKRCQTSPSNTEKLPPDRNGMVIRCATARTLASSADARRWG